MKIKKNKVSSMKLTLKSLIKEISYYINFINIKNKKEENGFLKQVERVRSKTEDGEVFIYKNLSFFECRATDAQAGRAPVSKAGVLRDVRVQNSFSLGAESPVRGAQSGL